MHDDGCSNNIPPFPLSKFMLVLHLAASGRRSGSLPGCEERFAWSSNGAPVGDLKAEALGGVLTSCEIHTTNAFIACATFEAWLIGVRMRGSPPHLNNIYMSPYASLEAACRDATCFPSFRPACENSHPLTTPPTDGADVFNRRLLIKRGLAARTCRRFNRGENGRWSATSCAAIEFLNDDSGVSLPPVSKRRSPRHWHSVPFVTASPQSRYTGVKKHQNQGPSFHNVGPNTGRLRTQTDGESKSRQHFRS